ncbi:MAG: protein-disulfide reductase DsbD domain-containing protein, partial [bacterium]
MRLGKFLLGGALAAAVFLPGPAAAQSIFEQELVIPDVLTTVESKMEPATARPGEHVRLVTTVRIAEGWYIYSLVPQGGFAPPPTKLTFEPSPLLSEGPVYETNPIVKKDNVFDMTLAFHKPAVRFYANFQVPADAQPGAMPVAGQMRHQVCNDKLCTPPRNQPFLAALTVEDGPVRPAFGYIERTIDFLDKDGNFIISADTLESALAGGLVAFLMLAAGFGFLAL